ncbi:unnamed protein product [Rotaria socialis]|uniref:HAT C-terminal dimerisation domain-containing protein n=2 Tax=Rotaria socialis TaxID=392032 RepID=A0A817WG76_9BILA|nr:unnamed protein product [Rotaria socialis]
MNEDDQGNDNDHQNTITSNNVNSEEGQRRQRSDSTASNTTEVTKCEKEIKKTTTMTKEDVLSHFTTIDGNMKCKLCKNAHNVFKANDSSDTNLRRHLAYVHNLNQFLYPSQLQNRKKASLISTKLKQQLDKAAIDAISVDGRSFGDLGKEGITKFLNLSNPGKFKITTNTEENQTNSDDDISVADVDIPDQILNEMPSDQEILSASIYDNDEVLSSTSTDDENKNDSSVSSSDNNEGDLSSSLTDNEEEFPSTSTGRRGDNESITSSNDSQEEQETASDISDDDSSITSTDNDEGTLDTVVIYFDQNKLFDESNRDLTILLSYVHSLLKRTRKLINMIHKSSVLDRYVKIQLKAKQRNVKNQLLKTQQEHYKDFIIDFKIRWNTTFLTLERFLSYCSIIINITQHPSNEIGLNRKQHTALTKLAFNRTDWVLLMSVKNITLLVFQYIVINSLRKYLTTTTKDEELFDSILKQHLLQQFDYYFGDNFITKEQNEASIISAFLDPALYHYLIRDPQATPTAEKLILKFYENNRITPRSTSSQTTNVTNTSQSSSLKQQSTTIKEKMHLSILNRFFQTCGINETVTTTPMNIQSVYSIKEQMSFYVTKAKQMPNFQQFWTHFGAELPDLARVAKYFSSMQVTSYSSESSFSMSGYINRKNRCSLSSSALRFSMCLKKQYEQTKMKI